MPAARHLSPALDVEKTLGPFARRAADVGGKQSEGCGYFRRTDPLLHSFLNPSQRAGIRESVISQERWADRFGRPVNHDVSQEFVFGKAGFDIAAAIAPG